MMFLLDSIVKTSFVMLVTLAAAWMLRGSSAATRHVVLAAGLACAALSPAVAFVLPEWRVEWPAAAPARAPAAERVTSQDSMEVMVHSGQAETTSLSPSGSSIPLPRFTARQVLGLWTAGVAAALLSLVAGFARLGWIARRAVPATHRQWLDALSQVAARHALPRPPRLLQSGHPSLLVTWGVMQPTVLLPVSAPEWSAERMRIVLDHELAHIARHDWLVQIAAELLRCFYWFNPLVWTACRRLRQESEQACDDRVLAMGHAGPAYAAHLLDLARAFRSSHRVWIPAAAIARPSSLERRVAAMLTNDVNRQPVHPRTALAAVLLLLSVTLPIASFDAFAQGRFASVFGTVTDQGGGVLVNATVALSNMQTKAKYEVRTNGSGYFEVTPLPAGNYELTVRSPGFVEVKQDVTVSVGESMQRNLSVTIGNVQETISVSPHSEPPSWTVREGPRPTTRRPCADPSVGGCINPPVKVKDVRPLYPQTVRDQGIQGVVMLQGVIDTEGRMKDIRVTSSPHPELERLAIDAIKEWEFAPTLLNGKPIDTPIQTGVYFDVEAPKPSRP